jgi:hypothetical protein
MRLTDVDALLDRHRERFRRLLEEIAAEEAGEDPFAFSLHRFQALGEEEKAAIVERASIIARTRVERELERRRAAWLVVVGDDVVAASPDPTALPSPEEVLRYGEPSGRVAYLFEAPLIEEVMAWRSPWSLLRAGDRYPTLPLSIEGLPVPRAVVADLDTGSPATFVDAGLVVTRAITWFTGQHLGSRFLWSPVHLDLQIMPADGQARRRSLAVRRVRAWSASPFVRINPSRAMLVGRDVLRAFGLTVLLAASRAESEVTETQ